MFAVGERVRIIGPYGDHELEGGWDLSCDENTLGTITRLSNNYERQLSLGGFICVVRPDDEDGDSQWVPASAIEKLTIGDEKLEDWL